MKYENREKRLWKELQSSFPLSNEQISQFQIYATFLVEQNELANLTALTELKSIIRYHFIDSLMLNKVVNPAKVKCIADIGPGAGFPSIPLKIRYPHLKIVLIEVGKKKQRFLQGLIDLLGLKDVEIVDCDLRSFVRITDYPVDVFVTRAALRERELCRVFQPGFTYKDASLVYWAGKDWQCDKMVAEFVKKEHTYKVGHKTRKLVLFKKESKSQ